ncbi:hypothetical protein NSE_0435 [Neorickettsia sennetsu str. Miyayama]|uniref:Uncharacterized protein n=1 Tax=Ehrlichia sennetsu (strain ATCC VR-367 / Miyayama) TaxID=222891 RepID=Q2GDX6_EHRS3|nr:hypothetical protein NSE_0435 [Neorickettsia sennetsu str. Miyayama]
MENCLLITVSKFVMLIGIVFSIISLGCMGLLPFKRDISVVFSSTEMT